MKIDTFFIVNALLMVALVAGATYLQKTYNTDKNANIPATIKGSTTISHDSGSWHVNTSTAPANQPATPTQTTVTPPPKTTSAPAVHRVYNEVRDDD